MRRDGGGIDERFAAYVRERGDHHPRAAVLLTGDWHAAEDLVQASLVKLYRAWPRLGTDPGTAGPDAYLRRIMVNTHRSWWRARWRREIPAAVLPESASVDDIADRQALGALVRQALARLPGSSGRCWCCGTAKTGPKPRSPGCWAARWARSRPTRTAACTRCAICWAASSTVMRSARRELRSVTAGEAVERSMS